MPRKYFEDIDGVRRTYKTVTLEELYPEDEHGNTDYELFDLFVYSVTNNPDGADAGTAAKYIGTSESYTQAADLMVAAEAASEAIGGGVYPVEFCLSVNYETQPVNYNDRIEHKKAIQSAIDAAFDSITESTTPLSAKDAIAMLSDRLTDDGLI